ncbi:MAG: TerC family protein [Fimbriimonadales bacterium]|nr:TerC family protein [Fimbriimonadales bacterium]
MFGQTFQPSDLLSIGFLVLLEGLLSADNALVLAILVKHLPKSQQRKALLYGLAGAFVFRLLAILFAAVVLRQWWLQAVGALYLLYLPYRHFRGVAHSYSLPQRKAGFWPTVVSVELTDIAFALDSVLAGIGFIARPGRGVDESKIWVVYLGAVLGIVLLRFAAGLFVQLLERYPKLDHVAYAIVGWIGVKLGLHAWEKAVGQLAPGAWSPHLNEGVFWGGLFAIAIVGSVLAVRQPRDGTEEAAS